MVGKITLDAAFFNILPGVFPPFFRCRKILALTIIAAPADAVALMFIHIVIMGRSVKKVHILLGKNRNQPAD